jgi:hypothetical protein
MRLTAGCVTLRLGSIDFEGFTCRGLHIHCVCINARRASEAEQSISISTDLCAGVYQAVSCMYTMLSAACTFVRV